MRMWLLWLAVLLPLRAAAGEGERILRFHQDIVVGADASLTVTETIRFLAGGEKIKRGLRRYFPVVRRDRLQNKKYGFEVLKVLRDGEEEQVVTTLWETPDFATLTIGRPDVLLPHGEHEYVLTYRTTRHILHFGDHDELYWNVNGTLWKLKFDKVSGTVAFPEGAKIQKDRLKGYTGGFGKRGEDVTMEVLADGRVHFETTRPFEEGENLTIVVPVEPGALAAPTLEERWRAWIADNLPAAIAVGGFAAVAALQILMWVLFGRDPGKGVIVPRAEPPTDPETGRVLSPGEVRFVRDMEFGPPCVMSAVIDMGVKGYLVINESAGKEESDEPVYSFRRLDDADETRLSPDEKCFAETAFGDKRKKLKVDIQNKHLFLGVQAMQKQTEAEWGRLTFRRNGGLVVLGWTAAAAVALGAAFCTVLDDRHAGPILASVFFTPVLLLALHGLRWLLRGWLGLVPADSKLRPLGDRTVLTIVVGVAIGFVLYAAWYLAWYSTIWVPLGMLGVLCASRTFGPHLRRYTRRGRRVMDEVDGLALYLATAEGDGSPPPGVEHYETLLPYAIALGLSDQWTQSLQDKLGRAAGMDGTDGGWSPDDYEPAWYRARKAWSLTDPHLALYQRLGYSLTTGLAAATTVTGSSGGSKSGFGGTSSSGGGGGGFSGGGSGGGGGEGW